MCISTILIFLLDPDWFPFLSFNHALITFWNMEGTPLAREKTDHLLLMLRKEMDVKQIPSSYKTLNRWIDAMLPILPLATHRVKV